MAKSKASVNRFMAEMLRASYYQFFLSFWNEIAAETLHDGWYIRKLCEELQELSERVFHDDPKEYDLIWNCPPGTTKSSIVSVLWQPWIWTRMPSARFISGSYAERLALDLSRKSRDVVLSDKYKSYFPDIKLRDDQNTKGYFANTQGGIRYAVGVGGSVIGMHAHFIAVDDPIDPQGVLSDLILEEANNWMGETLSRRKVNLMITPTVTIMQRLHQNDPTGYSLEKGIRIRHRCIPCDTTWPVTPESWKQFYESGLLDPTRLPEGALEDARKELGEVGYAGQYGQCLVAGTIIETLTGSRRIEEIQAGELVATREGWKKVLWAGETKRVSNLSSVLFENGSILSGTGSHPIWTENRGFAGLDSLQRHDYNRIFDPHSEVLTWADQEQQEQKSLNLGAFPTFEAGGNVILEEDGGREEGSNRTISIGRSGEVITVTFPLAMTSIIWTMTQATITLTILNVLPEANMERSTAETVQSIWSFLQKSVRSAFSGTVLMLEENTIKSWVGNLLKGCGPELPITGTFVLAVSPISSPEPRDLPNTAPGSAKKRVVSVYDLTIQDCSEFFANGILVHNSPIPRGGALFKVDRLQYANPQQIPDRWKRGPNRYWDKAATLGKGAYTVGTKEAMDHLDRIWVLDVVRCQLDSGQREQRILETARLDGKAVRQIVEQEPAGSGKESAESTIKRLTLAGYRASADKVTGDKELRADPFSEMVNMGNVILVNAHWNHVFVEELRFFPRSKYKDQVDSASGCFASLVKPRYRIGALGSKSRTRSSK